MKTFIAENIKKLRIANGLSQESLAKEIGIKRSRLGSYEEGRAEPDLLITWKLAQKFEVTMEELIQVDITSVSKVKIDMEDKVFRNKIELVKHLIQDIEARYILKK